MRYIRYYRKSQEDKERQVLSLPSQHDVAESKFGGDPAISVIKTIEESRSAKVPGRPFFNGMLDQIERGEAEGIIAYSPDRLARNSVDAGRIIYLLDLGLLKDIKFVTYTFENNPAGKLMLQIMLAQSKHFSDALSERVLIGLDKKLELGWRPNRASEGYLNEREQKTVVADPERFALVRAMFDLFLRGATPAEITRTARDEWGYLTRRSTRSGGRPLALSTVYKMLRNPFYAGLILWKGQLHQGKHTPIVTLDEFNAIQARLTRTNTRRPQRHQFAFTGTMRCGSCNLMVTAEQKVKPSGRAYIYYHCTKRGLGPRCSEPPISRDRLHAEIVDFLKTLDIDPRLEAWALSEIAADRALAAEAEEARIASLNRAQAEVKTQLDELTGLRLRRLLSDEEFVQRRQQLETEHFRLSASAANASARFELVPDVISMRKMAVDRFLQGDDHYRRLIFEMTGSNPRLKAKKLIVEAARPFVKVPILLEFPRRCGVVDDVHHSPCPPELLPLVRQFIKDTADAVMSPECETFREKLREYRSRYPEQDQLAEAA